MADTGIEWTDKVWNPVTGCTKISHGCKNCYAARMAPRLAGRFGYPEDDPFRVTTHVKNLRQPLGWKRPKKIFVNSMSDLFHEDVPEQFIKAVFGVMRQCERHTFQILTKRPERMFQLLSRNRWNIDKQKPLPNVWLGVSAENQETAVKRIPLLLKTPAAVRFVSCEPLLSEINLSRYLKRPICKHWEPAEGGNPNQYGRYMWEKQALVGAGWVGIDWVIVGGESGPGARPMHPDWVRSLRDQCMAAEVSFFFKQWGEWNVFYDRDKDDPDWQNIPKDKPGVCRLNIEGGSGFHGDRLIYLKRAGKKKTGNLLDGKVYNEFPVI